MKTFWIIYSKTNGLFLGNFSGYAIFSKQDLFESTRVPGFSSEERAKEFVEKFLPKIRNKVEYLPIPTKSSDEYVELVEIIKAGYKDHALDLFENMYTDPTLH